MPIPALSLARMRELQTALQMEADACLRALGIVNGQLDLGAGTVRLADVPSEEGA